jgi:hypothetical protein
MIALAALLAIGPVAMPDDDETGVIGDIAVQVGHDGPAMDACGGVGRVIALDRDEMDALAVHTGPDDRNAHETALDEGTLVWLCEARGDWQGIVYPEGQYQDLGDCRVSSPVAQRQAYAGPCRSGWVLARYVQLVAG